MQEMALKGGAKVDKLELFTFLCSSSARSESSLQVFVCLFACSFVFSEVEQLLASIENSAAGLQQGFFMNANVSAVSS